MLRKLLIASVIALGASTAVFAHSWYDTYCCNTTDCAPLPAGSVVTRPDGWYITHLDVFVPRDYKQLRESQDMDFHACFWPNPERQEQSNLRCFYVPSGGA